MYDSWFQPFRDQVSPVRNNGRNNRQNRRANSQNGNDLPQESLTSNLSRTVRVHEQQAFQVCAFTTGNPDDKPSKVIVTLGNPEDRHDFDLFISDGGTLVPVEFDENGVFVYEEPILNTCALLYITFKAQGHYLFELDLVLDRGNIPLANLIQDITAI